MDLEISISIPELWGDYAFQKNQWGSINYLVGPNGTGKSLFAEKLVEQCKTNGLKVRYLNSERLSGLEKQRYHEFGYSEIEQGLSFPRFGHIKNHAERYGLAANAFITLREKIDVKLKIEAILSQMFSRTLRLSEEGGFLNPKLQVTSHGEEYDLKSSECHGLKELITLLVILYDDDYNCIIIDEPELHLHPQFQTFLINEIRNIAGNPVTSPAEKCFFIASHSPYFLDVRNIDELKNCIIFKPENVPSVIDNLDGEDKLRIQRLLPRLNTHHKQLFFATRPIFVEGYLDQLLFNLIQEKRGVLLGATGSCIIDVGGKDELDLFYRISKKLGIDSQFITDLDSLMAGKLRQTISNEDKCTQYLHEMGVGSNLMNTIGEIERKISECINSDIAELNVTIDIPDELHKLINAINGAQYLEIKRSIFLIGLSVLRDNLSHFSPDLSSKLDFIEGKLKKVIDACKRCGLYVLSNGQTENYLPEYNGNKYVISDNKKAESHKRERNTISNNDFSEADFRTRYDGLIDVLDEATGTINLNLDLFVVHTIRDWIYNVQSAFSRGEVTNEETFKQNSKIEWKTFSRIFDLVSFHIQNSGFECKIKLKPVIDNRERELIFNNSTAASTFTINNE